MLTSGTVTMRVSDQRRLLTPKAAPLSDFARLMRRLHLDGPLLVGLLLICGFGLFILYSAVGESNRLLMNQAIRLSIAFVAMLIVAQLPPDFLRRWTPWGYLAGLVLLVLVLTKGDVGQGARRWLDIGIRFQPSEAMKLAVPMMAAWFLHARQMPPKIGQLALIAVMIAVPTVLIAKQPDLGTSLLIAASGVIVIVLAGMSFKLIAGLGLAAVPGAMVLCRRLLLDLTVVHARVWKTKVAPACSQHCRDIPARVQDPRSSRDFWPATRHRN